MSVKVGSEYIGYIDPWTDEERLTDEEIVRCKDCGYMEQRISFDGSIGWFLCTHSNRPTRRDGFCVWGERRTE